VFLDFEIKQFYYAVNNLYLQTFTNILYYALIMNKYIYNIYIFLQVFI